MKNLTKEEIEKIKVHVRALSTDKRSELLSELIGWISAATESHDADKRAHARFFFKSIELLLDFS